MKTNKTIAKLLHSRWLLPIVSIVAAALLLSAMAKKPTQTQIHGPSETIISGSFDPFRAKSDDEWRAILSPAEYKILRQQGTEVPFTGALNKEKRKGTYYSVGCDIALFRSEQKYDSGTGWPSFWAPISDDVLVLRQDNSLGEPRIEVLDRCGGHLGHVFDDGPQPTGKRYCMNSVALRFVPDEAQ